MVANANILLSPTAGLCACVTVALMALLLSSDRAHGAKPGTDPTVESQRKRSHPESDFSAN